MQLPKVLLLAMLTSLASGHAIPIWEMLPRHEKIGQIMYAFVHLVDQTCSYSYIPDCHRALTLHGLSNLVNMDEFMLNRLDPFQSGGREAIWSQVLRGVWDLPPAYLPYYLMPEDDEITNEIESNFPSSPPQPSSPNFLYPYAAIPTTYNKPVAAVDNPHPYAVKIAPPPGFSPSTHTTSTPSQKVEEEGDEMEGGVDPEDRFAEWSDSETILGEQAVDFDTWSNGDVIVGNQAPVDDIYASWSDAEMIVDNQEVPEDRFASWSDSEANQEPTEDRFASWSDSGANQEPTEDRFASWSDSGANQKPTEEISASWSDSGANQEPTEDRFASWSDNGANQEPTEDRFASWSDSEANQEPTEDRFASWSDNGANQEPTEDRFASWSDSGANQEPTEDRFASWSNTESTNINKQTETDRYAAWRDSEAGLSDKAVNLVPAGIQPTADFEPLMVESRVVVSRVAPPASMRADQSVLAEQKARRKRGVGSRSLLPLPLLRQ